jgi:hypothetical protein
MRVDVVTHDLEHLPERKQILFTTPGQQSGSAPAGKAGVR